jgi:hypothetical protein
MVTHGRTVLLPKIEDLSDERECRPITYLSTCYKIFTGNVGCYVKEHAERNNIWDRSQVGTCSGVLGTVDRLIVDNSIMDEVREKKRNLAVAFSDYRKAYDMIRHDWILRVYRWMRVPEKVLNVLSRLMEGWKTRLEVTDKGEVRISRWINIRKGFLQGDSYSAVSFLPDGSTNCNDSGGDRWVQDGTTRRKRPKENIQNTQSIHRCSNLEIASEMIVNASMDTGAYYGVKKCAEVVFKDGKMVKGEEKREGYRVKSYNQ